MQSLLRHVVAKDKVVVVMGATGTGKSKLSIDLATRFQGEIINSDKIQMYEGLDVLTNKITEEESCGVPHHLMSFVVDPLAGFTSADFCRLATDAIRAILGRGKLPIVVGGSNSFIQALVEDLHSQLRYQCCFLWVDVSMPVLHSSDSDWVDQMVQRGMADEIAKIYTPNSDYSKGIKRSIRVPVFHRCLQEVNNSSIQADEDTRARLLEEAISQAKINRCKLVCRQRDKINQLRTVNGWKINRIDATQVFQNRDDGEEADKAWENLVVAPCSMIVAEFLMNEGNGDVSSDAAVAGGRVMVDGTTSTL